jgi:hypothetical protein
MDEVMVEDRIRGFLVVSEGEMLRGICPPLI